MPGTESYLLDTNILLYYTRAGSVADVIEATYHLRQSNFRPLICEVTLGEIEAFARKDSWGEAKRERLRELQNEFVAVDISDSRVIHAYADLSTLAEKSGWGIRNDKNDLWIAAATRVSGAILLTTDKGFREFRDGGHLDIKIHDAKTGAIVP